MATSSCPWLPASLSAASLPSRSASCPPPPPPAMTGLGASSLTPARDAWRRSTSPSGALPSTPFRAELAQPASRGASRQRHSLRVLLPRPPLTRAGQWTRGLRLSRAAARSGLWLGRACPRPCGGAMHARTFQCEVWGHSCLTLRMNARPPTWCAEGWRKMRGWPPQCTSPGKMLSRASGRTRLPAPRVALRRGWRLNCASVGTGCLHSRGPGCVTQSG
jgi:hypothetical protein